MPNAMRVIAGLVSGGLCVAAGIYLLTKNSAPIPLGDQEGQSWLEVIAHGIGIYFLGKGVFVWAMLWPQPARRESPRPEPEGSERGRTLWPERGDRGTGASEVTMSARVVWLVVLVAALAVTAMVLLAWLAPDDPNRIQF